MGLKIDRLDGRQMIPLFFQGGERPRQARRFVSDEGTTTDSHAGKQGKQFWLDLAAGRREQGGVKMVATATQLPYRG